MKLLAGITKYEILLIIFTLLALFAVIGIWIWFGYRTQQMEAELYLIN